MSLGQLDEIVERSVDGDVGVEPERSRRAVGEDAPHDPGPQSDRELGRIVDRGHAPELARLEVEIRRVEHGERLGVRPGLSVDYEYGQPGTGMVLAKRRLEDPRVSQEAPCDDRAGVHQATVRI